MHYSSDISFIHCHAYKMKKQSSAYGLITVKNDEYWAINTAFIVMFTRTL